MAEIDYETGERTHHALAMTTDRAGMMYPLYSSSFSKQCGIPIGFFEPQLKGENDNYKPNGPPGLHLQNGNKKGSQ